MADVVPGVRAALALVLGTVSCARGPESPRDAVARAVAAARPLRARLSIAATYRPCSSAPGDSIRMLCSGADASPPSGIMFVAPQTMTQIARDTTPDGRHTRALWLLQFPTVAGLPDSAVNELKRATDAQPDSAAVWSDLSAALLVSGAVRREPAKFMDAAAAAERATRLAPASPAARFNLALSWDALGVNVAGAWDAYLARDGRSPYAAEGRERRARAVAEQVSGADSLITLFTHAGLDPAALERVAHLDAGVPREYVEVKVLGRWGDATLAGEVSRADSALALSHAAAEALSSTSGDSLTLDAVTAITDAQASHDAVRVRVLATGHRAYAAGVAAMQRRDVSAGAAALSVALRAFVAGKSPMVWWTRFWLGVGEHYQAHYDRAAAALEEIAPGPRYKAVRGHALRVAGLAESVEGNVGLALRDLESAAPLLDRTGEHDGLGRVLSTTSDLYYRIGLPDQSARIGFRLLRVVPSIPAAAVRHVVLLESADQASSPGVAIELLAQALMIARQMDDPAVISGTLNQRAIRYVQVGQFDSADADVRLALTATARVPDASVQRTQRALALLTRGEAAEGRNPAGAMADLDSATAVFHATGYSLILARADVERSHIQLALHHVVTADSLLDASLREVEGERSGLGDSRARQAMLDRARDVFEQLIGLKLAEGDTVGAHDLVERMRARVLLERLGAGDDPGAGPDVNRVVPRGVTLVEYVVTRDRLYTWLGASSGWRVVATSVPAAELDRATHDFEMALTSSADDAFRKTGARLYRWLITPIASLVDTGAALVFIPDQSLHRVPFSALWDEPRKQFLVEAHAVAVAPSAAIYRREVARAASLARWPRSVVSVGDPAADPALPLPALPGARAEAADVAQLYPVRVLLTGAAAQSSAVFAAARTADVVHLAVHAIVREDAASESELVFAAGRTDDGLVDAARIANLRWPHARLVVLSACQSAAGQVSLTEGATSLARAFLSAGVPAVLANLWPVADQRTAWLQERFHRALVAGRDPAAALQLAQRDAIAAWGRSAAAAAVWGGFEVIGR